MTDSTLSYSKETTVCPDSWNLSVLLAEVHGVLQGKNGRGFCQNRVSLVEGARWFVTFDSFAVLCAVASLVSNSNKPTTPSLPYHRSAV